MVGAWLVKDLLARKARVVVLVHDSDPQSELFRSGDINKVTVVNGTLEDYRTVERAINEQEADTIIHLGAQTIVSTAHHSPLSTFEVNIRGTYNLLEAARVHIDRVKRVVIASSDKAYGYQALLPYTEEMSLAGQHPYEVSKSCADLLSQSYWHTYGLPVAIARCGNIYGGGDLNWSRIVPGTIRSLIEGNAPIIRSDGSYIRDYVYVKDICGAYLLLAENLDNSRVCGYGFNFSNETALSVLDLVAHIQRALSREDLKPTILNKAKGEIKDQYLSAAKAHQVLGWHPTYTLYSGIQETVEWYQDFLKNY